MVDVSREGAFFLGLIFMAIANCAVLWAARPTPSEQIDACHSIMRLPNEHTHTQ